MFKTSNPYDEVVAKATDEKQTVENWDILLTVWDKVNEDGEAGARNCVAALQKRLAHRSANVQLFSLTLAEALVNNCGAPLHREISGKAFTQSLVRIVNDRTTHEDVKKRVLKLVEGWAKEYRKNPDFDVMVETYEALRSQNHRFNDEQPPTPSGPSDKVLRREEEDLQRALAESAALSDPLRGFQKSQPSHSNSNDYSSRKTLPNEPEYSNRRPASPESYGFAPPTNSSVVQGGGRRNDSRGGGGRSSSQRYSQDEPREEEQGGALRTNGTSQPQRVKALYDFNTETPEELPFRKGDVIRVLECVYEAWWRGELKGRVGIFPTVYVEEIVEPTPASLAQEAENEAALFAQSASIDKLLNMMRSLEGQSENLAENEDLLELYQQSMSLRPKVVKLIEKYNQKQTELRLMNEKFTRAKTTYDSMIEESMQRYSQPVYAAPPQQQQYAQAAPPQQQQQQQQYSTQQQQNQADAEAMAGWTPEQRREYDAQWAAYHAATQQYYAQQQQYYAQQGLPVPQGSQLPDVQQGTHYATQDPARQQQQRQDPQGPPPTDQQQQAQYYQQHQQQQAPPAQVAQTSLPPPQSAPVPVQHPVATPTSDPTLLQPYWDAASQQWLWPQQPPPTSQPHVDPNLSSPTSPHQYSQPPPTTAQSPPPALQSQPSYSTAQPPHALVGQMEALSMDPTSPSLAPTPQSYPAQPYPAHPYPPQPSHEAVYTPHEAVQGASPYPPAVEQAYYAAQPQVGQQVYGAAPTEGYRY